MSEQLTVLLRRLAETTNNGLGEALRALTFVGEGYGCYSNFDVRPDAVPWPEEYRRYFVGLNSFLILPEYTATLFNRSHGYRFHVDVLAIDVFWVWDDDGTLFFRLTEDGARLAEIVNTDCKYSDEWQDIEMSWPVCRSRQDTQFFAS